MYQILKNLVKIRKKLDSIVKIWQIPINFWRNFCYSWSNCIKFCSNFDKIKEENWILVKICQISSSSEKNSLPASLKLQKTLMKNQDQRTCVRHQTTQVYTANLSKKIVGKKRHSIFFVQTNTFLIPKRKS